jgi:Holliday junction DNA helicase RuvA
MFRHLISVNGIGPRLAQNILSGVSSPELRSLIGSGDTAALTGIPGIGKKTADRIIIELREKVGKDAEAPEGISIQSHTPMEIRSEALEAMLTLGFQRSIAEKAIRNVLRNEQSEELSVEILLKKALRSASSR